jgi:hypothetical protein
MKTGRSALLHSFVKGQSREVPRIYNPYFQAPFGDQLFIFQYGLDQELVLGLLRRIQQHFLDW